MDLQQVAAWVAPMLSTIIVTAATASINARIARGEKKRDEAQEATEAKRKAEAEWREAMSRHMAQLDEKMGLTTSSLQSTMRATLIHNAEKYFSRGSITPEEHASWCDMHDRYSSMGFNGLIDTYRTRIDKLPHVTIEHLISESKNI